MHLAYRLKTAALRLPIVRTAVAKLTALSFRGSRRYWEARYHRRGNSGIGSRGRLASHKAEVINELITEHDIESLIDFGCGDGFVASLLRCHHYVGLDVSPTAVTRCRELLAGDASKHFQLYEPRNHYLTEALSADLALSLDVIYHLPEDELFHLYMGHLFDSAERFVLVYSTAHERPSFVSHVRHRDFRGWVSVNRAEWQLAEVLPNRYSTGAPGGATSECDFYLYQKGASAGPASR